MNLFTIIVSGLILLWIIIAVRYIHYNKNNKCGGNCKGWEKLPLQIKCNK